MRKQSLLLIVFTLTLTFVAVALGQTDIPHPQIDTETAPLPVTVADFWQWGIALVSPIIIWLAAKTEKLPRQILPILTPLVGIALGAALKYLATVQLSWMDMAQAGALAVFIREVINQNVTKNLAKSTAPTAKPLK